MIRNSINITNSPVPVLLFSKSGGLSLKGMFSRKKPKISVIIPVYNVEDYLRQCLDSVINQTLDDIEIICVNDGSTDSSPDILEEYSRKDSRIRIISQENMGLSGARNTGMKYIKGEYVYFLDSDDYIELDALNQMYNISKNNSLDMLMFKTCSFDDVSGKNYTTPYFEMEFLEEMVKDNVFSYRDLGEKMYDLAVAVHGVVFKSDLVSDIRFPQGLIFEDNPFFTEALFRAKKVMFYRHYLHHYRTRSDSLSNAGSRNFSDIIEIRNRIIELAKKYDNFDEYAAVLYKKKLYNIRSRFLNTSDEYKEDFFAKIQADFKKHEQEYKTSEAFKQLKRYYKSIFNAGLTSKDYKEFESKIDRK